MSKYFFGVSTRKVSRDIATILEAVAKRNDVDFVEVQLPDGYRRWFEAPNKGHPFDKWVSDAVFADLDKLNLLDQDGCIKVK